MAMMIRKMNNNEDGAVETAKNIAITLFIKYFVFYK
jgi:hypothetical protein